jgi:hypothetical protein
MAAAEVWTASTLTDILPDSAPGQPLAAEGVRLYAALGERESFQIALRDMAAPIEEVEIRAGSPGRGIPAPEVRRLGYMYREPAPDTPGQPSMLMPGPLLPAFPTGLPPGETGVFWVTYTIPRDARPGVHRSRITVAISGGRNVQIPVSLVVLPFELPETPSLTGWIEADLDSMLACYPDRAEDLSFQASLLAAFTASRLSVTPGSTALVAENDDQEDLLGQLLRSPGPEVVSLLNSAGADLELPAPENPVEPDPLQPFLSDLGDRLEELDLLGRVFAEPVRPADRESWQAARETLFRYQRADVRIPRLLRAAPHPFFERYADIWAVPLFACDPLAIARLRRGMSLRAEPPFKVARVDASSSGPLFPESDTLSAPEDASDGSLFTAWRSAAPPGPSRPQWIEIHFEEPVSTDRITVGWTPDGPPEKIDTYTSHSGELFGDAAVTWTHRPGHGPAGHGWSEGRFKLVKTFIALRLVFRDAGNGRPVGVTEFEFGAPPDPATIVEIPPVRVWLDLRNGSFPSPTAGSHPVEARVSPWVCWSLGLQGFTASGPMVWPEAWSGLAAEPPLQWPAPSPRVPVLGVPGPDGVMLTVAAERLGDGIEDYDLLLLLRNAVDEGRVSASDAGPLLRVASLRDSLSGKDLERLAEEMEQTRVEAGRLLSIAPP